jgi:hypothetical protein
MPEDIRREEALRRGLLRAFDAESLGELLFFHLNKKIGEIAGPGPFGTVVAKVIRKADEEGWIRDLVRVAHEERPTNTDLTAVYEAYQADPPEEPPGPEPLSPPRTIWNGHPLINRCDFYRYLLDLYNGDASVVVVDGPRQSGKSFSYDVLSYFARRRAARRRAARRRAAPQGIVFVDLESHSNASPYTVAVSIVLQMDWSPAKIPDRQEAQEPRWAEEISEWLVGKFRASEKTWWLVFDNCNCSTLTVGTRCLVERMALRAFDDNALRVILLSYPGPLPRRDELVSREVIEPLNEQHLRHYFTELNAERGQPVHPEAIEVIVRWVLARVPSKDEERCRRLATAVRMMVREFFP